MAIKRKVSKSEFETLTEEIKSLYVEKDGEYFLDIEGFDESAAKRAKDREKELRKEAEENARRYKEELNSLKAKKEKRLTMTLEITETWRLSKSHGKRDIMI